MDGSIWKKTDGGNCAPRNFTLRITLETSTTLDLERFK
jgi:hypothetical protein